MEDHINKKLDEHTELLKSIRRATRVGAAFNILRFLLLLIPFIIAFIYLPQLVEDYKSSLFGSFSGDGTTIQLPQGFDLGDIQQYLERN